MANPSFAVPAATRDFTEPEQQAVNETHVQQLKLAHVALELAPLLYKAARVLYPEHPDYPMEFKDAPSWIQRSVYQQADLAVARVNPANEQEAERVMTLSLEQTVKDAERDALLLDADHSKRSLVAAALMRMRRLVLSQHPVGSLVSLQRQTLKGRIR